ncbi:MAG TPA: cupin domain-containing protein [Euzebyales bacterium]|nr:cupin domain-containing protein [Euzebyales bacterium]
MDRDRSAVARGAVVGAPVILARVGPTGGGAALVESVETVGRAHPMHRHQHEDEIVYVVAGTLAVVVGGRHRDLRAGEAVVLPRRIDHAVAARGGPARILTIYTPAGFERYLAELAAHTGGGEVEHLIAAAARYGCTITAPAIDPRHPPERAVDRGDHARSDGRRTPDGPCGV